MRHQQGATMIIVLVVLLLIAIAGTIAVRSGLFGARLSTNTQVNNLLINNNDAALFKFEDMSVLDIKENFAVGGFYHYLKDPITAADELIFCYQADEADTFKMNKAAIVKADNSADRVPNFCTATGKFSSGRNAIITQVHVRVNDVDEGVAEGYTMIASDTNIQQRINLSVSSISVMPSFVKNVADSGVQDSINECFKKTAFARAAGVETVTQCFNNLNVPYDVQSADFVVGNRVQIQSKQP